MKYYFQQLTRRATRTIERNAARIAERSMWETVGRRVASSDNGIGKVILENSRFSRSGNGVFTLTNRPNAINIRGGASALLDVVKRNGVPAERQVIEAAEQLAHQSKITGKLQGVVRVGSRVLIIAGAAADGYRIYTADDKIRETVKVAGGIVNIPDSASELGINRTTIANCMNRLEEAGIDGIDCLFMTSICSC